MRVEAIDHIQLAAPVDCEATARWFFGELLGLTEIRKPASLSDRGGVWFEIGWQQLHIGTEEPFTPARKAHPALRVAADDMESLAARLSDAGVELAWDDAIPDTRRFYAQDPWGNRLEFVAAR